ncbi:helix-turn-helix domain-containing protein [Melioribacter sp. OK-6-Me]|uniref:helix-turn-helix domain-containing protein n=1 Tax=unclassified Melioribacter TaxID=2627329 RepID=UPI003EDABCF3
MAIEAVKKFAEELKSLREEKGFTLQQISNHTRIDINFLKQIEEGNFDVLPEIYIKAFIKEYAEFIGLNPEDTVKKYQTAKKGIKEVEGALINSEEEKKELPGSSELFPEYKTSSPNPLNKKYVYLVAALVAVVFLIYFLFLPDKKSELTVIEPETTAESKEERFEIDSSSIPVEEQLSSLADDSLQLHLETTGAVWIKVVCDSVLVIEKIVSPNTALNFKAADRFYVAVGNAAYVKMNFNGKPIESVGGYAEVRNYYITPDSIRSYLIPVKVKNENKSSKKN